MFFFPEMLINEESDLCAHRPMCRRERTKHTVHVAWCQAAHPPPLQEAFCLYQPDQAYTNK